MHVLLIEPDTALSRTYTQALLRSGNEVSCVRHAQDAVHAADEKTPDVVVLELQMAGHNGIEFLYEFRSYPEWYDIPVVVLTMVPPHSLRITQEQMTELGIIDCLYKPSTKLDQLVRAVQEAV